MCEKGEHTYGSKNAARRAHAKMHQTIRAYWCDDHKGYHVTKGRVPHSKKK